MSESLKAIIGAMPESFDPDAAGPLSAVFQFDISGDEPGQWYLTVHNQTCKVDEGMSPAPNVTLNMASADFVDMMTGRISGQAAFFSGKLRVSGDLMLAQRLEGLFKRD